MNGSFSKQTQQIPQQIDRSQRPVARLPAESSNHDSENRATLMLQDAMLGTNYFDKLQVNVADTPVATFCKVTRPVVAR